MILTFLSKYRDLGLLFLRVSLGFMFILHGWPKLAGGVERWEAVGQAMSHLGINFFPVFFGLMAALAETLGGLLFIVGFLFRPACLLLAFTMFVATVMLYKTTGEFIQWSRPAEMAMVFIALIFIGAGRYSVDRS